MSGGQLKKRIIVPLIVISGSVAGLAFASSAAQPAFVPVP